MALLPKRSRTNGVSDPAKLLVSEHEKVERLFAEIERTQSAGRRNGLVAQLDADLSAHMAEEEQLLYPFISAQVPNGSDMVARAEREHEEAKAALAKVVSSDVAGPQFPKTLKALKKLVTAHVKEEEKRVFPALASAVDGARLGELRGELEQMKFATIVPRPLDEPQEADFEILVEAVDEEPEPAPAPSSNGARSSSNGAPVWVQSHPDDKRWQVKREGASRASRVFDTQKEAEAFARNLAKREKVELVIAGRNGRIRNRDSYGNDPVSSKG